MSKINESWFSSATDLWATPRDFFDVVNREFNFTLDVCATPANAKCPFYLTEKDDALTISWWGRVCWMNPPYGRTIGVWMAKAWRERLEGATVVCLVPARTDTRWWHDNIPGKAAEVRFLKGRLKFGGSDSAAPFPSALVVYRPVIETPDALPRCTFWDWRNQ